MDNDNIKIAKAHFSRICPSCGKWIIHDKKIAQWRVKDRTEWVHLKCARRMKHEFFIERKQFKNSELAREVRQMSADFYRTARAGQYKRKPDNSGNEDSGNQ